MLAIILGGCAGPQHLPGHAHWYGSAIWVPKGDAAATASAVCNTEPVSRYNEWEESEEVSHQLRWRATKLAEEGELLDCLSGVQEQFTR